MKIFRSLTVLGALALPAVSLAAMAWGSIAVHVPFSFVAAGCEFPSGDYRVENNGNGVLYIQGAGKSVITLSIPSGVTRPDDVPNLQFTRAGGRVYLTGVQTQQTLHSIPLHVGNERKITLAP